MVRAGEVSLRDALEAVEARMRAAVAGTFGALLLIVVGGCSGTVEGAEPVADAATDTDAHSAAQQDAGGVDGDSGPPADGAVPDAPEDVVSEPTNTPDGWSADAQTDVDFSYDGPWVEAGDPCDPFWYPVASVAPCVYPLPTPEAGALDPDTIRMRIVCPNDELFPLDRVQDGVACTDTGWHFGDNAVPIELNLCETPCALVEQTPGAIVEFNPGCLVP